MMARALRSVLVVALLGGPTWVSAADRPVDVQRPPNVSKDLAAMPRIAKPRDDAERKINAAVSRLDAKVRKAAAECRHESGGKAWWERSVAVAMAGPGFLSYSITDNTFCGGAHPNVGTMAIVYDLKTGSPVDWTALLPPALTGKVALAEGMDGTRMVTLASPRLHELYRERYRPKTGDPKVDAADDECRESISATRDGNAPAMTVWPDARERGLALWFDLPHAVQACVDEVVIPAPILRSEGATQALLDALANVRPPMRVR